MAKRYFVVICAVMVVGVVLLVNAADRSTGTVKVVKQPGAQHPPSTQSRSNNVTRVDGVSLGPAVPKAFGTITYDTLFLSSLPIIPDRTFGNRFNTALTPGSTAIGPVQVNGSVTHLTWVMWGNTTQPTWGLFFLTIFGPVSGTTAPVLATVALAGAGGTAPGILSWTLSPAVNYAGPSFLVGLYNSNSLTSPPWNGPFPVFDANTNAGQGFHGMGINWNTTTGTGFVPMTTLNAIMRPRGNVLTPVELMNFTVE
jgi:hypothetical protein